MHMFDDYHYNSAAVQTPRVEDTLIKSKSRALKIHSNLKKVKQPISPCGKLANFINSLFTTANTKKSWKNMCSVSYFDEEQRLKSVEASTCSSASSFSRSCPRKHSPTTREKTRNGDKRTVRFYPVSIIVDEDCRPCAHKSLCKEEQASTLNSVSLPTAWQIGKLPSRKVENETKYQVMEKSKRVEEMAREFLKAYHQSQKKNDKPLELDKLLACHSRVVCFSRHIESPKRKSLEHRTHPSKVTTRVGYELVTNVPVSLNNVLKLEENAMEAIPKKHNW